MQQIYIEKGDRCIGVNWEPGDIVVRSGASPKTHPSYVIISTDPTTRSVLAVSMNAELEEIWLDEDYIKMHHGSIVDVLNRPPPGAPALRVRNIERGYTIYDSEGIEAPATMKLN